MRVVHVVDADFVHLVEDVAQVCLAIHAHPLHGRHNAAYYALLPTCGRVRQLGLGIKVQRVQMRQQFGVDEVKELPIAFREEFLPLPTVGFSFVRLRMLGLILERRGPILPAEGADQRGREGSTHRFGSLSVALLLRIEDAEKKNPR